MPYSPQPPTTISNWEELRQWLQDELRNVSLAINETQILDLRPTYRAPDRLRDGIIVYADGVSFNPGSGEGPYVWDGAAWKFMATPAFVPPTPPIVVASVSLRRFTSSGTYTPSTGMIFAIVECVGGGGGGGGVAGNGTGSFSSGGGGSGGYSRKRVTAADIGVSKVVTIGAAGNGGAAGLNNGGAGGDTSVGTLCSAKGGGGGSGSSVAQSSVGGVGGAGSGGVGDLVVSGAPGSGSLYCAAATNIVLAGGTGGSSFFGGGATATTYNAAGVSASNHGGGGSGAGANAALNLAGGSGSIGVVVITEFTA